MNFFVALYKLNNCVLLLPDFDVFLVRPPQEDVQLSPVKTLADYEIQNNVSSVAYFIYASVFI